MLYKHLQVLDAADSEEDFKIFLQQTPVTEKILFESLGKGVLFYTEANMGMPINPICHSLYQQAQSEGRCLMLTTRARTCLPPMHNGLINDQYIHLIAVPEPVERQYDISPQSLIEVGLGICNFPVDYGLTSETRILFHHGDLFCNSLDLDMGRDYLSEGYLCVMWLTSKGRCITLFNNGSGDGEMMHCAEFTSLNFRPFDDFSIEEIETLQKKLLESPPPPEPGRIVCLDPILSYLSKSTTE